MKIITETPVKAIVTDDSKIKLEYKPGKYLVFDTGGDKIQVTTE